MKRSSYVPAFLSLLTLFGAIAASAQIEDHPGYFPIDRFGILDEESLSLEINLDQGLLQLVSAALGGEEPEFAELVGALESIRVRVAPAESFDVGTVRSRLGEATNWLEDEGWSTMLRVREDGEEVYVYVRLDGGEMQGIAVLAMEMDGDAVLVNVVGSLDPERLAALAEVLDVPQLGLAAGIGVSNGEGSDTDEEDPK